MNAKPASARGLTDDQIEWHRDWRGSVAVVETIEGALLAIGVRCEPPAQP
ncbi:MULTISPECIES: hypothetical protein [Pseudomonadota]|nr:MULTISPECIES: hypothetical protein [Pseudomonadota]